MKNKRDSKKSRIEAVVIALIFIGTALIVPINTIATNPINNPLTNDGSQKNYYTEGSEGPFILDRSYYLLDPEPASTSSADNDDAGTKRTLGSTSQELLRYTLVRSSMIPQAVGDQGKSHLPIKTIGICSPCAKGNRS